MDEHKELILDGTKINWHLDRVQAWERGVKESLPSQLIWH